MTPRDAENAFSAGAWQVHPNENRIFNGDRVVALEPRVMSVLVCLGGMPGRIVSADKLLDMVWQGRAHGDHTVYQAIADLRKALGDDASNPRYIETIPKKGYRLICPVNAAIAGTGNTESKNRFRRLHPAVALAAGLVSITAMVFWAGDLRTTGEQLPTHDSAETKSIAVLPFANLSSDPEQGFFSDGLSDEIRNMLSTIPGLKVIGRTSSHAYQGKIKDIRSIGNALGVTSLLEGTVQVSGDRVRINAQLVDASDGTQMWSASYDRPIYDVFLLQDDVATAVVDAMQVFVSPNWTRGRPTDDPQAFALFLKARAAMNVYDDKFAEEALLDAVELDPEFAEAYEMLAVTYFRQGGDDIEAAAGQKLMGEAAANALAIDPDLVLARALYEAGDLDNWSLSREIAAFEDAARKQPNNPELLNMLAWDLFSAGYLRESLKIIERLIELDPLSPTANARLFESLYAVGQTDEAIAELELQARLGIDLALWNLGLVYLASGQDDLAVAYLEKADQRQLYPPEEDWMSRFITEARDPATGPEYLDRHMRESMAFVPEELAFSWSLVQSDWYLLFGHIDRYYEVLLDRGLSATTWTDADRFLRTGHLYRRLGYTAHPGYLEVARSLGIMDVWEQRGPPDFCHKTVSDWTCE